MSESKPPKTQTGIVGFFDILGYSSFLENNSPEVAAGIVREHLLEMPKGVYKLHPELLDGEDNVANFRKSLEPMKWLVFSDTVLLALPYDNKATAIDKNISWFIFLLNALLLYRHMFDSGLPLRGAVSFGEFFVEGTCFVGRPIIEAYRAANEIDLACIVIADKGAEELSSIKSFFDAIHKTVVLDYLVPLKDRRTKRSLVVLPSHNRLPKLSHSDLRQAIAESFWRYNKDLSPTELAKLENTELFFRFCQMRLPGIFSGKVASEAKG